MTDGKNAHWPLRSPASEAEGAKSLRRWWTFHSLSLHRAGRRKRQARFGLCALSTHHLFSNLPPNPFQTSDPLMFVMVKSHGVVLGAGGQGYVLHCLRRGRCRRRCRRARSQAGSPAPAGDCSEGEARKALPTDTSREGGGIERERGCEYKMRRALILLCKS